jgi:D-alanyl-D-alanine carboxypeptidase
MSASLLGVRQDSRRGTREPRIDVIERIGRFDEQPGQPCCLGSPGASENPVARFLLPVCIPGLLLAAPVAARADRIDGFVRTEMQKRRIPGLALAVVRSGKVVKIKAYGLADLENDVRVRPDSVFELASLSKSFTAAAVMLLVEQGKVGLDDPINAYLPDPPDAWKGITVRHLLTHTGGLAASGKDFQTLAWTTFISRADMYAAATKDPVDFKPGERWQYSDAGYFLLGMIIEKASGQPWAEFLAERIFKPLGMSSTSCLDLTSILNHRVHGYGIRKGQRINIRRVAQLELFSHGGVFSTVEDLAKWDAALDTETLLKRSSLEQILTPARLNDGSRVATPNGSYGFGWFIQEKHGHRFVFHPGITGVEMTRFLDDKLTIIVLTNLGFSFVPGAEMPDSWGLTTPIAGFYLPDLIDHSTGVRGPGD